MCIENKRRAVQTDAAKVAEAFINLPDEAEKGKKPVGDKKCKKKNDAVFKILPIKLMTK